mmetsp:Transcript_58595/g.116343  ORF Transcript_58595/g.116343 Transcript_58595/m.116343 type:complete len:216 (+) Transcript_58595:496-1143(+)
MSSPHHPVTPQYMQMHRLQHQHHYQHAPLHNPDRSRRPSAHAQEGHAHTQEEHAHAYAPTRARARPVRAPPPLETCGRWRRDCPRLEGPGAKGPGPGARAEGHQTLGWHGTCCLRTNRCRLLAMAAPAPAEGPRMRHGHGQMALVRPQRPTPHMSPLPTKPWHSPCGLERPWLPRASTRPHSAGLEAHVRLRPWRRPWLRGSLPVFSRAQHLRPR